MFVNNTLAILIAILLILILLFVENKILVFVGVVSSIAGGLIVSALRHM